MKNPKFNQGDVVMFDTWPMAKIPRIGIVISVAIPWNFKIKILKSGEIRALKPKIPFIPVYVIESGKKNYSAVDKCLTKLGTL